MHTVSRHPFFSTNTCYFCLFVFIMAILTGVKWSKVTFLWLCFGRLTHKVLFGRALSASIDQCLTLQTLLSFYDQTSQISSGRTVHIERAWSFRELDKQGAKMFLGPCSTIHDERIRQHRLWSKPARVCFGAIETSGWSPHHACSSWLRTRGGKRGQLGIPAVVSLGCTLNSSPTFWFGCISPAFEVRTIVWKCLKLDCLFSL